MGHREISRENWIKKPLPPVAKLNRKGLKLNYRGRVMSIVVQNGIPSKGMSFQSVAVWPDGAWCFSREIEEYLLQGNSYDYTIEHVPSTYDDDNIEMFVLGLISGAYVMEGKRNE